MSLSASHLADCCGGLHDAGSGLALWLTANPDLAEGFAQAERDHLDALAAEAAAHARDLFRSGTVRLVGLGEGHIPDVAAALLYPARARGVVRGPGGDMDLRQALAPVAAPVPRTVRLTVNPPWRGDGGTVMLRLLRHGQVLALLARRVLRHGGTGTPQQISRDVVDALLHRLAQRAGQDDDGGLDRGEVLTLADSLGAEYPDHPVLAALERGDYWPRAAELAGRLTADARVSLFAPLWGGAPDTGALYRRLHNEMARLRHAEFVALDDDASAFADLASGPDRAVPGRRIRLVPPIGPTVEIDDTLLAALTGEIVLELAAPPQPLFTVNDLLVLPSPRSDADWDALAQDFGTPQAHLFRDKAHMPRPVRQADVDVRCLPLSPSLAAGLEQLDRAFPDGRRVVTAIAVGQGVMAGDDPIAPAAEKCVLDLTRRSDALVAFFCPDLLTAQPERAWRIVGDAAQANPLAPRGDAARLNPWLERTLTPDFRAQTLGARVEGIRTDMLALFARLQELIDARTSRCAPSADMVAAEMRRLVEQRRFGAVVDSLTLSPDMTEILAATLFDAAGQRVYMQHKADPAARFARQVLSSWRDMVSSRVAAPGLSAPADRMVVEQFVATAGRLDLAATIAGDVGHHFAGAFQLDSGFQRLVLRLAQERINRLVAWPDGAPAPRAAPVGDTLRLGLDTRDQGERRCRDWIAAFVAMTRNNHGDDADPARQEQALADLHRLRERARLAI